MAVEGSLKLIKYLMLLFNLIFFIIGLVLVIVGIVLLTGWFNDYVAWLPNGEGSAAVKFIVAVGAFILVFGFLGCCGAWFEKSLLLTIYTVLLIIIFALEVGVAILAVTQSDILDDVKTEVQKSMMKSLKKYDPKDAKDADTLLWDNTQKEEKCCGVVGASDYEQAAYWNKTKDPEYPASCCAKSDCTRTDVSQMFKDGCFKALNNMVNSNMNTVKITAAIVALIQVFGVICSCCLISGIRKNYEHV